MNNMINEMPCGYGTLNPLVWKYGIKSPAEHVQQSQHLSKSPADLRSGLSSSTIWLF